MFERSDSGLYGLAGVKTILEQVVNFYEKIGTERKQSPNLNILGTEFEQTLNLRSIFVLYLLSPGAAQNQTCFFWSGVYGFSGY